MKWRRGMRLVLAVALPAAAFGLVRATPFAKANGRVQRGKYLVSAIGCGGCHTPKTMGPAGPRSDDSRFLSGHPKAPRSGRPPCSARGAGSQ